MKVIVDIEANGFIPAVNTIWMVVAKEVGNDKVHVFSDYAPNARPLEDLSQFLEQCDTLIGHNLFGYDIPVLERLTDWRLNINKQKVVDTLILSWLIDYKRQGGHSLKNLGRLLGCPKDDYKGGFDAYSDEMLRYCIQDCRSTEVVYNFLFSEARRFIEKKPLFKDGIRIEHKWAYYEMRMRQKGWRFDMDKALSSLSNWESRMKAIEEFIEPNLPHTVLNKGEGKPRIRADGAYMKTSVSHLGILPERAKEDNPVEGPFTKIEIKATELGSMDTVKSYLEKIGWIPDDWNAKKIAGQWIKTSSKLTDSSLEALDEVLVGTPNEGIGSMISEYYTLRSRKSIIEGWIKDVELMGDGRLHGKAWVIGTPTFRCRHEVICNIPSVSSPGGAEMRGCLIAEDGYKVVGADSSGNQFRALAHYMKDDDFTESVINGDSALGTDVHSRNAKLIGCDRKTSKPFIYALLFGGGAEKLGLILTGKKDKKAGSEAKKKLMKGLPGLKELKDKVENLYYSMDQRTGRGCFPALDGRIVYPQSGHQALNYLLQAAEAITCKAALVYAFEKMESENLDFYPTLFYHDELCAIVREDQAERAKEIMVEAFREAPKTVGVTIMDGDGAIGESYASVH